MACKGAIAAVSAMRKGRAKAKRPSATIKKTAKAAKKKNLDSKE